MAQLGMLLLEAVCYYHNNSDRILQKHRELCENGKH